MTITLEIEEEKNKEIDNLCVKLEDVALESIMDKLTYTLEPQVKVDWDALDYEYDTFERWADHILPSGLLEQWPCLIDWAKEEYEKTNKSTPLEELKKRNSIIYNNEHKQEL